MQAAQHLGRCECSERSLLYSMSLLEASIFSCKHLSSPSNTEECHGMLAPFKHVCKQSCIQWPKTFTLGPVLKSLMPLLNLQPWGFFSLQVLCYMKRCNGVLGLQHAKSDEMWVAAGTIFLDVLIWRGSGLGSSAKPLYRLKGHEGSIHRSAPLQPLLM